MSMFKTIGHISVNFYFTRRRFISNGISTSGLAIGMMAGAILTNFIMNEESAKWRVVLRLLFCNYFVITDLHLPSFSPLERICEQLLEISILYMNLALGSDYIDINNTDYGNEAAKCYFINITNGWTKPNLC